MSLELYYRKTCPFCQKVLRCIEENAIEGIIFKDKSAQPEYEYELAEIGGKTQVPCLVIDGKAMYESDAIVDFLKQEYA